MTRVLKLAAAAAGAAVIAIAAFLLHPRSGARRRAAARRATVGVASLVGSAVDRRPQPVRRHQLGRDARQPRPRRPLPGLRRPRHRPRDPRQPRRGHAARRGRRADRHHPVRDRRSRSRRRRRRRQPAPPADARFAAPRRSPRSRSTPRSATLGWCRCPSTHRWSRCWRAPLRRSRARGAGSTSRSGTDFGQSSSATATSVHIASRNALALERYFPELIEPLQAALPERAIVDGEVVIATDHGLDFDALQQRIHPAASRVRMLSEKTPASVVLFDLLALDARRPPRATARGTAQRR